MAAHRPFSLAGANFWPRLSWDQQHAQLMNWYLGQLQLAAPKTGMHTRKHITKTEVVWSGTRNVDRAICHVPTPSFLPGITRMAMRLIVFGLRAPTPSTGGPPANSN